jgi:hypothetical protein
MMTMANEPKHARKKGREPGRRENGQGDHERSAHSLNEFDALNPQKQGVGEGEQGPRSKGLSDDR